MKDCWWSNLKDSWLPWPKIDPNQGGVFQKFPFSVELQMKNAIWGEATGSGEASGPAEEAILLEPIDSQMPNLRYQLLRILRQLMGMGVALLGIVLQLVMGARVADLVPEVIGL
jgi:hypothetical protein